MYSNKYHLKVSKPVDGRVPVIKIFSKRFNMSLMEAKSYVDGLPRVIILDHIEEARSLAKELLVVGVEVDIREIGVKGNFWHIMPVPINPQIV